MSESKCLAGFDVDVLWSLAERGLGANVAAVFAAGIHPVGPTNMAGGRGIS